MTATHLQRGIAGRLEQVRKRTGFTSLRSFQEDLVARSGQKFSYTAARNYHDEDVRKGRMPPVDYLNAVSRAFRVRLEWLVRGEGSMTESAAREGDRSQRLIEEWKEVYPGFRGWPKSAQESLIGLHLDQVGFDPVRPEMGGDLVKLVMFPLGAWGFRALEELNDHERLTYFSAMMTALSVAARSDLDGNRLPEYPNSPLPCLRRFLDGDDLKASDDELRPYEERKSVKDYLEKPAAEEVPSY